MATEVKKEIELEIAHVLFIDIVAYSKLSVNEQHAQVEQLNEIVRLSEQFLKAEAAGRLLKIPTGDGMALVFYKSPEEPAQCAVEISRALKGNARLQVRMGIHSGPVSGVVDVNERTNVAGGGINTAQRVMDCGDAGHILLSHHVAEDLEQFERWRPFLHDIGTFEVKHGMRVSVTNLHSDEVGNPQLPSKLRAVKKHRARLRGAELASGLLVLGAIVAGALFFLRRPTGSVSAMVEKSIAVLPFENLSEDKSNAYFAEGMQDEILARLSKIADLKVISRTSTQKYKSAPDNLREIAKQLGVANVLEGSVQRAADQVRVNVQLINALNDAHLWGEIYDRKLTDIFAVESDIAKTISDTLQAKLTAAEKQMIAVEPTSDMTAYELYLKGRLLWGKRGAENIRQSIALYEQAIAHDPNYALAYSGLADAYIVLPAYIEAAPGEAFSRAKTAALKALQLDDNLAEAHTALAMVLYNDFDLAGSISEFKRAIALNPNYANAHYWYGIRPLAILGRFDEAIAEIKRAIELDPLSAVIRANLGGTLRWARRYDGAIAQLRKTMEIDPTFYLPHFYLGEALQDKGDLSGAIPEYTRALQLNDTLIGRVYLAAAKTQSGNKGAAQQMLTELEELSQRSYVPAYLRALLYLSLGNRDEAIRWLEQSFADYERGYSIWITVDPLRGDPRFEALVQKVVGAKHQ